ncbi:MAG: general secretion pathway protein GspB [Rudaea sp.]|uniref:general secretion pathway protein GspB n=1 Tax=Rudaea sp. TaxID=2136325 RepID=UPI0039E4191E
MSLILEALKKSEAQRRLGEMPDLGTPITTTRRRRSPLPWLSFAVVVALAAAGAWYWLRPSAPQTGGEQATTKAGDAPGVSPHAAPPPRRTMPKPVAPPPPTSTGAPVASSPTAPTPAPRTPAAPARTQTAAPAPAMPPVVPAPPPVAAPAPSPPATPAQVAPAGASVPPAVPADDVPSIDELPPDVRAALPALPITMQVYSPDPKRRFVIIDGARVVEGDEVRGVTVREIRQSGLVLEFHGHRALLRPGP